MEDLLSTFSNSQAKRRVTKLFDSLADETPDDVLQSKEARQRLQKLTFDELTLNKNQSTDDKLVYEKTLFENNTLEESVRVSAKFTHPTELESVHVSITSHSGPLAGKGFRWVYNNETGDVERWNWVS